MQKNDVCKKKMEASIPGMTLDIISYQKGVRVPGRNIQHPDYNRVFDETARRIYEAVAGRGCPESVKVI